MNFHKYADKGNLILNEVASELGKNEDKKLAGRMLRSVLHVLRSRLTIEESFQLIAQLPMAIKAVYVDGWSMHLKEKKVKTIKDFVEAVSDKDFPVAHIDFPSYEDGEKAIRAVFNVLIKHISKGEIQDIMAVMPPELRPLWEVPTLTKSDEKISL